MQRRFARVVLFVEFAHNDIDRPCGTISEHVAHALIARKPVMNDLLHPIEFSEIK